MSDPFRVKIPDSVVNNDLIEDPGPGHHLWITTVAFRVSAATVAAVKAGTELGPQNLDHENVLTIGMGCYKCEQPLTRRMLYRDCKGSMEPM